MADTDAEHHSKVRANMNAITILLVITVGIEHSYAQYSHVRYQPEQDEPYLVEGFNPAQFKLPARQETPSGYYRVPETKARNTYGVPADSYQVPSYTYLTPPNDGTSGAQENIKVENIEIPDGDEGDLKTTVEGAYYVLLPGSQLQRVQFQTENDVQNMAYTARLQYRNEDRAPIFVYTAQQYQPTAAYVNFNKQ